MCIHTQKHYKNLPSCWLEEAFEKDEVRIRRDDGQVLVIRPESSAASPLDVEGIDLGITTQEIIECIHEGRRNNR